MSDHRPTRGEEGGAARLLASARARVSAALADLALPEPLRLSEWQRTTLSALLWKLVRAVEDDLRAALALTLAGEGREALHAALSSAEVAIAVPILRRARAFPDPALAAILLRRVEEHRLHRAAPGQSALLAELVADGDEEIAGEAMAILIAQSGRLDPFQEPVMGRAELDAELQHGLVWAIAAALRSYMLDCHNIPADEADDALAAAAGGLLAGYDEGATLESLCLRLARRLYEVDRLNDGLVSRAIGEGSLPLFLAALAVRSGLDPASAWDLLSDPDGHGAALLLRAAGVARAPAGAVLLRLYEGGEEAVAPLLDLFDTIDRAEARRRLRPWRADPAYRAAILRLRDAA